MRKKIMIATLLVLLLSACAPAPADPVQTEPAAPAVASTTEAVQVEPTAVPTEVPPTEAPVMTSEPSAAAAAVTEDVPAAGSSTTYKIVPGESSVTYEVGETFFNQNNRFNLAVGVTQQVSGEIQLDPTNPSSAEIGEIQVDISQFQSDSGRRDNAIQGRWLESATYPLAVFKPTSLEGLPETYAEGEQISFKVTGDLTVKQTTHPVTFDIAASLAESTLSGTATTTILLSQFGVGPITIAGMLGTEDEAKVTLQFVARP